METGAFTIEENNPFNDFFMPIVVGDGGKRLTWPLGTIYKWAFFSVMGFLYNF